MPAASAMAGVNMRLEAGAYRELHWHVASEWSLVLNGSCRIQVRESQLQSHETQKQLTGSGRQ
jgi:oxalate decarboxylase/phosphoglucose isomerase-like protein (cupin superfamily)